MSSELSKKKPIRLPAIVMDTREPTDKFYKEWEEIGKRLNNMGLLIATEALPVGDFSIGKFLIERKEAWDFYQSYQKRRLQNQLKRLIESSNGFIPVLLVEGNWNSVVGRIKKYTKKHFDWYKTKQAILTMYKKVIIRHDVKHFHTQNLRETCELLKNLCLDNVFSQETLHAVRHASKKNLTLDEKARMVLEGFAKVGSTRSDAILTQTGTLADAIHLIAKYPTKELGFPGVGPVIIDGIKEVLYHEYGTG